MRATTTTTPTPTMHSGSSRPMWCTTSAFANEPFMRTPAPMSRQGGEWRTLEKRTGPRHTPHSEQDLLSAAGHAPVQYASAMHTSGIRRKHPVLFWARRSSIPCPLEAASCPRLAQAPPRRKPEPAQQPWMSSTSCPQCYMSCCKIRWTLSGAPFFLLCLPTPFPTDNTNAMLPRHSHVDKKQVKKMVKCGWCRVGFPFGATLRMEVVGRTGYCVHWDGWLVPCSQLASLVRSADATMGLVYDGTARSFWLHGGTHWPGRCACGHAGVLHTRYLSGKSGCTLCNCGDANSMAELGPGVTVCDARALGTTNGCLRFSDADVARKICEDMLQSGALANLAPD